MGVEKNSTETRVGKTANSVDLYRPPALRNRNTDTSTAIVINGAMAGNGVVIANNMSNSTNPSSNSMSCNNSPKHTNGNANHDNVVGQIDQPMPSVQPRQALARRERRPDRAVYVPRARRSQTTPPITTTTTTQQQQTSTPSATNHSEQQQLDAVAIPVITAHSNKADANNGTKVTMKKPKTIHSSNSNLKERKERTKKSSSSGHKPKNSGESVEEHNATHTVVLIAAVGDPTSTLNPKNCDNLQPPTEIQNSLLSSAGCGDSKNDQQIIADNSLFESKVTKNQNIINNGNLIMDRPLEIINMHQLRIEDVAANGDSSTIKCDIDAQELERASKEINRSNRRIIKQTFISDVLEIPDHIIGDSNINEIKSVSKISQIPTDSTTEDEEDDWENMFDETGECLDPKVLEELTAAVGKVKIALPKMNYDVYLTKQNILNEEEFPHVLEVSNFPVEFKNQDLMMLFSQYKETGFDIKWVDDTHALAVFSSSRIAAEALTMGHPFVVLKPLAEATVESRLKAKKCAASLQPYRPRPETCPALARRLVSGALGVRLKTATEERENEKRVLRAAKERKLLAAKQRDEAWES